MPGLSAEWLSFLQMLPLPSQPLQDMLAFLSQGSWGETQARCWKEFVRKPHGPERVVVAWDEILQTPRVPACCRNPGGGVSLCGRGTRSRKGGGGCGGEMRTARQHWVRVSTLLACGVNLDDRLPESWFPHL